MGFQTPQYKLADFLAWTRSGKIQLPDFQRGYKWDEERISALLGTILLGHPLGVVMLLKTGNEQVRFKPKPLEGTKVPRGTQPQYLLLDGQQRLTSLTQALTGTGIVATKDTRGKLFDRRFYLDMKVALEDPDRIDDAVVAIPGDGMVRTNFNRDIELDLSTPEKERAEGYFPLRLIADHEASTDWLVELSDTPVMKDMLKRVVNPIGGYEIPAIELDESTSRAAVATVFEKVNTGGLPLNVFELLTATFAGDPSYYGEHGTDFRLNDDWSELRAQHFLVQPVLAHVENTEFLQAVTLLTTRERALAVAGTRSRAVSARRADILRLDLSDYLRWRDPLRRAFVWAATFLADHHIFDPRFVPYSTQLVPLAAIKVVLGADADLYHVRERIDQWFWCGVLGELYGGSTETRFARDLEEVPAWARGGDAIPRTVADSNFVQSRLLTLRTRNAAAYKGIYALVLASGAKDWVYNQSLGKVQYADLSVDIHHIFPQHWCRQNDIPDDRRESIVNKTAIAAATNRSIGGKAPSLYLTQIQARNGLDVEAQDQVLSSHQINASALRRNDFSDFFAFRAEALCQLVERATGKRVLRDGELESVAKDYDPDDIGVRLTDDEQVDNPTDEEE